MSAYSSGLAFCFSLERTVLLQFFNILRYRANKTCSVEANKLRVLPEWNDYRNTPLTLALRRCNVFVVGGGKASVVDLAKNAFFWGYRRKTSLPRVSLTRWRLVLGVFWGVAIATKLITTCIAMTYEKKWPVKGRSDIVIRCVSKCTARLST